jgi:hypothetical protein
MIVNLFGMHDRSLCPVFNRSCAGGSIVLPQGSAAFRAIVACYPFCPEEAPALASDVQIFIRDADDWAWHRTAPPLWKNTARTRRIRLSWCSIRVQGTLSMQISRTGCILVFWSPADSRR